MARPRSKGRTGLPENLYSQIRNGNEHFRYRSLITGRTKSIGTDRERAVQYAEEANREVEGRRGLRTHAQQSVKHGYIDYRGLLEQDTIAMKALMFDHICGVYFLLDQETIVYVGQSLNVMARLSDHRREGQKQFNRIFVVECKIGELTHLEALYIDKFKPIYNLARPAVNPESTAWDASLSDLLRGAVYEQN